MQKELDLIEKVCNFYSEYAGSDQRVQAEFGPVLSQGIIERFGRREIAKCDHLARRGALDNWRPHEQ
jgi:hypothetical protein